MIQTIVIVVVTATLTALITVTLLRLIRQSPIILNRAMQATCDNTTTCHSTRIPRVIYRTAHHVLSKAQQQAWDFTAKHNPEYRQVLFTDNEVDAFMTNFMDGQMKPIYDALVPGAARADLFRYCLMYKNGGVYLDIKSGARDLSKLIRADDRMLVSTWHFFTRVHDEPRPAFGEFQQWWLVCEANHPVMYRVIKHIERTIKIRIERNELQTKNTQIDVLMTTGPLAFTNVILSDTCDASPRVTPPDGNDTFIYDVAGTHISGANYSKGPLLCHK